MLQRRGLIFVLSSPSGAGKTTIARRIVERDPHLAFSISETTRPMRPGEQNHVDYHFVSQEQFQTHVTEDKFLEHAHVFGNDYGTPKEPVNLALRAGRDVIFDIDWQGARQLSQCVHDDLVSIFILPPCLETLEQRLRSRTQDDDATIRYRMGRARHEMTHWDEYGYVVINHDLERSVEAVYAILQAERLRRQRQYGLENFVTQMVGTPGAEG